MPKQDFEFLREKFKGTEMDLQEAQDLLSASVQVQDLLRWSTPLLAPGGYCKGKGRRK